MATRVRTLLILLGAIAAPALAAQDAGGAAASSPPPADSADVVSVDAIMTAVYDVISGPAGEKRDWDRMRSLFVPGARLIPTGRNQAGTRVYQVQTLEDYIEKSGPWLEQNGFFEREVARTMDRFGGIVHIFSTYESRRKAEDPEPFMRGINSFQLWYDGARWWVVTILWENERPDNPIPARYLESRGR